MAWNNSISVRLSHRLHDWCLYRKVGQPENTKVHHKLLSVTGGTGFLLIRGVGSMVGGLSCDLSLNENTPHAIELGI